MKRTLSVILLLGLISAGLNGQLWKMKRYEFGGGLSTTQTFSDIGGFTIGDNAWGLKDITFKQTNFAIGAVAKYRIIERVNVRLNLTYGALHSTDARGSNPEREYESTSSFFEPLLIGEYYIIKNNTDNSFTFLKGSPKIMRSILSLMDLYAFTGIGSISYSVKPNEKMALSPYTPKGSALVIPIGIGGNFMYSSDLTFGLELGARIPFTDTLEGYTSQYSKRNDMYYLLTFSVLYKARTNSKGLPSFSGRRF